jgi:hypothetical protein
MPKFAVGDIVRAASGKTGKVSRIGPNSGGSTQDLEMDHYFVDISKDDCEEDTIMTIIVPVDIGDGTPYGFTLVKRRGP